MKKLLFCMMVCAGFAACTSDDVVIGSSGATDFEGGDIYMKVYISDVASGTRGTGTDTGDQSSNNGSNVYANGTASEYAVNDAKFYFYDKDGVFISRASVWDDGSATNTDGTSVEYTSANMIVLKGLTSKQLPKYMVTILNEPAGFEDGNYDPANTLGELEQKLVSGITTKSSSTDYFIMSTSSYTNTTYDASSETTTSRSAKDKNYFVTELTDANFLEEPIDAVTSSDIDAVEVYVERLAAKVSVDTSIENSTTGYITGDAQTTYTFYPLTLDSTVGGTANDNATDISDIYVTFLGWTLNATARQSYIMKNVDDKWNSTGYWSGTWNVDTKAWNDSTRYRSYWGKGIAYGTGNFPESNITYKDVNSDGEVDITVQTDKDESSSNSSDWLNPYLQYTSLDETTATIQQFGKDETSGEEYALYCAENTNVVDGAGTAGLKDLYSSGITSVLLKAQAYTKNEQGTYDPLALVRYEGELFTADEFKNTIVRQEVHYDFAHAVDLAEAELDITDDLSNYIQSMYNCFEEEIYCANKGGIGDATSPADSVFIFDGSFLNLVDLGDGNVGIWPETSTAVHGTGNDTTTVRPKLKPYWDSKKIAGYEATRNLDNYKLYFKIKDGQSSTLTALLTVIKLVYGVSLSSDIINTTDGDYLLMDDEYSWLSRVGAEGNDAYTLRQYCIRAIEKEAEETNLYFLGYELNGNDYTYKQSEDGSITETNFYKDGLMYYSVPIEHLVEASTTSDGTTSKKTIIEGQYGVVRNHWYQLDITSLSKLGRGISDETAVIIPDPNGTDYLSVVANVNINAWQTVTQKKGL